MLHERLSFSLLSQRYSLRPFEMLIFQKCKKKQASDRIFEILKEIEVYISDSSPNISQEHTKIIFHNRTHYRIFMKYREKINLRLKKGTNL